MFSIKKPKNFLIIFIISLTLFGIASCSSKPIVRDFSFAASPSEEITLFERELNRAKEKQIDLLSPHNFQEAENSLEESKNKFLAGKDSKLTLRDVALGKAYLESANSITEIAREKLEDVLIARQAAINADSVLYAQKELQDSDNDLMEVTKDIEKNRKPSVANDRSNLLRKYLNVEINSIKEKNLRESKNIIAQAKKEGAKKFAPRTLGIAEACVAETEAFIQSNPHQKEDIAVKAEKTKSAAYHVFNLNRMAKDTSKVSTEEVALALEQAQGRATKNEKNLNIIKDELQTTQSALQKEKEIQNNLLNTKEELAKQNDLLANEKIFNQKYEKALSEFEPNEAEVFKQGETLLIRLKGIEFPSAKSDVQSKNYPLLAKVKKIITEFGNGSLVTIQGHTDSIGKKEQNLQISSGRAMAIKDYLEANMGEIVVKLQAVGLGDEKPLASNKTTKGRAQNRRVDVIIQPSTEKL